MIDEEEYDLRCAASDIVWEKCEKSSLFDEKAEAQVPRFHPHGKKKNNKNKTIRRSAAGGTLI
jgi:hypothetical protein